MIFSSKQIVSSNVVLDALRSKGNTALPQLVVTNIDPTKRKKEIGRGSSQKDGHPAPSNGKVLHLSIRSNARLLLADFPEPLQEY